MNDSLYKINIPKCKTMDVFLNITKSLPEKINISLIEKQHSLKNSQTLDRKFVELRMLIEIQPRTAVKPVLPLANTN